MKVNSHPCLHIHFVYPPELVYWLNTPNKQQDIPLATWHIPGHPVGDYSDIFTEFTDGELIDNFPESVEKKIIEIIDEAGFEEGIIWLSNDIPQIKEWAFDTCQGDRYDGYMTCEEAGEGILRMMQKGYSIDEIIGPFPIYEEE